MEYKKTLQELTIKDNFMFGAVMSDEKLCRDFLELVLGFKIHSVTVSKEKSIIYHPEYKGVRLDVVAEDENRTHYNIEMQVRFMKNLGKRTRYYHSQIDMDLLTSGTEYDLLPDSYVIFVCDFDPFFRKKYCYTFNNICKEDKELALQDGSHTIFLSTCGENEDEVPRSLVKFLKYVKGDTDSDPTDYEDEFVSRVKEAVDKIKSSREMEERYMLLKELIKEEREEAKAEGISEGISIGKAEGISIGKSEGKAEMLLEYLADLGTVPEEFKKKIMNESDKAVLLSYLKKASKANSMDEFLKMIQ